ncbi:MAG: flavin reductase family protein, partial [Silicimonas sp.]|nr:flavin reductase family protein [Silicimonas sp.]
REVDEFARAGITREACRVIPCSRVAHAPASLECELTEIVTLRGETNFLVLGEVVGVHLRDDCLVDGAFDVLKYQPLTRLGYRDYSRITEVFSLKRPGE